MSRDLDALLAFIEARQKVAHAYHSQRCCVGFAMGAVKAQTGIDHLADLPNWNSAMSAHYVAKSVGGLRAALDDRFDRLAPASAQRGDIAGLADKAFGVRLMIVEGATLIGPGEHGLERLMRRDMHFAWSAV